MEARCSLYPGIDDGRPRTRLADPDTLDRAAVASFAADGLEEVSTETRAVPGRSGQRRWLAEFTRRAAEPAETINNDGGNDE